MSSRFHPMQAGLPKATQIVWQEVDQLFGMRITGLGAWGDRRHAGTHSWHNTGQALDVMTSDRVVQNDVVTWALSQRGRLHIIEVISRRRIWSIRDNWAPRPYKGSSPHTDHVHLSIVPSAATVLRSPNPAGALATAPTIGR
jgi:hypothetical protein